MIRRFRGLTLIGSALICLSLVAAGVALVIPRGAFAATLDVCVAGPPTCTYGSITDAINAASPGDIVQVAAGTYNVTTETNAITKDNQIPINKPISIIGAGIGQTIFDTTPSRQPSGSGRLMYIHYPGGNVTISGFTIQGAMVNDQVDNGIDIAVVDPIATDTITISNNLFYSDSTLDPQNLEDYNTGIVTQNDSATTIITGNTFQGLWQGILLEGSQGPLTFTGNTMDGLHGAYSGSPAQLDADAEGMAFVEDMANNVTNLQNVSNNTFRNYAGIGIEVLAGYPNNLVGAMSNMSIASNTFTLQDANMAGAGSRPVIYLRGYGYTNGTVVSTISGTSITNNVINYSSTVGTGGAIWFRGDISSGNVVSNNLMYGSGTSTPLSGVTFVTTSDAPGVDITDNYITGFANGIDADTLPVGAQVTASQNCILGNSSHGATNAAGALISATNNWWGAANGPLSPDNAGGSGNAVSANITDLPYLTSPAPICAGPIATSVTATPATVASGHGTVLTAALSDVTTGNFPIASAEYRIDSGSYSPMQASDGAFDAVTENVTATVPASISAGTHQLCVRGTDSAGFTGAAVCTAFTVNAAATSGLGGAGGPAGPSQPPLTASNASSASSSTAQHAAQGETAKHVTVSQQANAVGQQAAPSFLALGLLAGALVLFFGGCAVIVVERRRTLARR